MDFIYSLLLAFHILVGLSLIGLVLIQHGKGADMGAAFGSGSSGSLFGASGSANFLSRTTGVLAAIFFATSLTLTYIASSKPSASGSVVDRAAHDSVPVQNRNDLPATPAPAVDSKAKDIPK
jgi:preprotein translocase subunit SecG